MEKIQGEFLQPWFDKLTMTICHPEPVEGWITHSK
jgi:hypothetical protein